MIKAVLFDFDGTLLNRDESVGKFIANQYERLNQSLGHIPKDEYIARFIELDNHGYVWKDRVYEQLAKEYKIVGMTSEQLLQDYLTEFKFHCVPFDHLTWMLETLIERGIRLGMITNGYEEFQLGNIQALGIEKYFDVILISEREGIKKPNPEIFHKALKRMNVLPEQSVFVGDHPVNDVEAAENIGMKGILKTSFQWRDAEIDFAINDLGELPLLIQMLNK